MINNNKNNVIINVKTCKTAITTTSNRTALLQKRAIYYEIVWN